MNGKNWTIRQKIGQLIVVRASGFLFDHQIRYPQWEVPNTKLKYWLENLNLGGVILLGGSAVEIAKRTQQLQNWATYPLLICADIEEGVGQRFSGATWFPPPMSLGAIAAKNLDLACQLAQQMGEVTAKEALAIGINWLLAPTTDVNNNPNNPVINIRAFGESPEVVSDLVRAFILGAKNYPVLTTAKHFPGHGDTDTDSHLHLPVIRHNLERLESVELPPFQATIAAKVDTIMTAHLLVEAWDQENAATLSSTILTGQLREKLGFEGLIVTDALIMGGVAKSASPEEVAIRALEAGADILLMPPDPEKAIFAIEEALRSGRLTLARIEQSLAKIEEAKAKLSLFSPLKNAPILTDLSSPQARETVTKIINQSLRIGGNLPLAIQTKTPKRNLIIVDDLLNCDYLDRACPSLTIPRDLGYQLQLLDQTTIAQINLEALPTLLQVFVRGNPFRGTAGLTEQAQKFYQCLLKTDWLNGLILYGSPYVLDWFKSQLPLDFSWVFSYAQIPQAQAIACQMLLGITDNLTTKEGVNWDA